MKNLHIKSQTLSVFLFIAIIIIASFVRLYGLNWDQGQHLHPDERFLTLVATGLHWPQTIRQYFDTATSPLNPHNTGNVFYVYGTWPVVLVKLIAESLNKGDYGNLTLVGRFLSAITDVGTTILVFFLTKRILKLSAISSPSVEDKQLSAFNSQAPALLAMLLYAIMALPIQLSHFYTTDPYLTFSITATLLLLTFKPNWKTGMLTGLFFGLAMAAKISAAPFLLIILISTGLHFLKDKKLDQILIYGLSMAVTTYCSLRIFMPYLFADSNFFTWHFNPKVIANWKQLQSFDDPKAWFPPGVQWIHTTPFLFPLVNIIFIGLGFPLAVLSFCASIWTIKNIKKNIFLLLPLFTILLFFLYEGAQFAKPMRYFYAIYPSIAVLTGIFLSSFIQKKFLPSDSTSQTGLAQGLRIPNPIVYRLSSTVLFPISIFLLLLLWPIAVMSIYAHPVSRVTASEWIYTHIPPGSTLTMETWDDGLPLNFPGHLNSEYTTMQLPMYDPDSPQKWREINDKLSKVDYLILSSNRVYGSIPSDADRFPETAKFYEDLFAGRAGFTPVAQFTSRPRLPIPGINLCIPLPFFNYGKLDTLISHVSPSLGSCSGIQFLDDYADESWTVYDHPKVIIFQKNR